MKYFTALIDKEGEIFYIQTSLLEPENPYQIKPVDNGYYRVDINSVNWTEAVSELVKISFKLKKILTTDFKDTIK